MHTPYELKQKVMNGVYRTYILRRLSHPAVRVGALVALLFAIRELTFVSKVIENAVLKQNPFEFYGYFVAAFTGTELVVQLVVIAALGVTAFMVKDAAVLLRAARLQA